MARLTIEDCWWTDPRRTALGRGLGDLELADGVAASAWRLAQEFWKREQALVPKSLFDSLRGALELIRVGLADVREGFVYVRGSSAYLDWIREQREIAKIAGKKSAEIRRAKTGSAQPKGDKITERRPNGPRTESNVAEPSVSFSSSFSSSEIQERSAGKAVAVAPASASQDSGAKLIAAYIRAFKAKYGDQTRPEITGKTAGQVKALLKSVPIERAVQLVQVYLQMDDRWFETKHHDFGTFIENLTKIGVALDTGQQPGGLDWSKVFGGANDSA